jgi:hypothetical protein
MNQPLEDNWTNGTTQPLEGNGTGDINIVYAIVVYTISTGY